MHTTHASFPKILYIKLYVSQVMWRLISSNRVKIGVGRFGYNVRYMSSGKDLLDGAKTSIQHGINLVKTGTFSIRDVTTAPETTKTHTHTHVYR